MLTCDVGDTVVVPFPFTDLPLSKRRPAVVLSHRSFNRDSGQSILGMITSARQSRWPSDIEISELAEAGIAHPSVIRFKLFTLPNQLIIRQLGALAAPDLTRLRNGLNGVFA